MSLSARVMELVRKRIVEGQLRPGERINSQGLAQEMGMSRIPVRDALMQLEGERLVAADDQGWSVASFSPEQMRGTYTIRDALERTSARLCSRMCTPEDIDRIREMAERLDSCRSANWGLQDFLLERDFHTTIAGISKCKELQNEIGRWITVCLAAASRAGALRGGHPHADVVNAIASGDPDLAEEAMCRHIRSSAARLAGPMFTEELPERPELDAGSNSAGRLGRRGKEIASRAP